MRLKPDDELIGTEIIGAGYHVMLFSDEGKVVRFQESDLRAIGRVAAGVRGIRLRDKARVISLLTIAPGSEERSDCVLIATVNGYGKRTSLDQFSLRKRGGYGVISIQTTARNGRVAGAILVDESNEVMLITTGGTLVRTRVADISTVGRNTQGVRLIRLSKKEQLIEIEPIAVMNEEGNGVESAVGEEPDPEAGSEPEIETGHTSEPEDTE